MNELAPQHGFRELALFAGAGGGILGGILLGWRCVCAVELEPYCRRVLMQRQNDGVLHPFPIWDDVRTFDGLPWRGKVDVVSGGFPCQDISAAGKGAGITGARSGLWAEMARIIGEVRPRFVLVENSPLLISRGLDRVLGDLSALGYDARWGIVGAHHAGAPHKRDRIWIVADSGRGRCGEPSGGEIQQPGRAEAVGASQAVADANGDAWNEGRPSDSEEITGGRDVDRGGEQTDVADAAQQSERESADQADAVAARGQTWMEPGNRGAVADAKRAGLEGHPGHEPNGDQSGWQPAGSDRPSAASGLCAWWDHDPAEVPESGLGRVAHGVANRVDRIEAIGNGQVPAVVRLAWETLNK